MKGIWMFLAASILVALLAMALPLGVSSQALAQESRTWYVDDDGADYPAADFTRIQDAVNAASVGDTIIVYPGTYTENVDVNKDHLTIQSENGANATIVQAANSDDHVFEVMADYVNISGFTVKGAGEHKSGIRLSGSYTDDIENCNISNNIALNNWYGIHFFCSSNNTLANNTALDNILGVDLPYSSGNALTNNIANSNTYHGITLDCSDDNVLTDNVASSNNYFGIHLNGGSNNTLTNNMMENNRYNFNIWSTSVQNIDTSNMVNGKPIQYLVGKDNLVIDSSWSIGYLGIVNCTNIMVRD